MLDADQEDCDSLYPTDFDLVRLKEMLLGDAIESENGNWKCFKYSNEYFLILNSKNHKVKEYEFAKLEDLILFLKRN